MIRAFAPVLFFLCACLAHAGPDNPGPPLSNVKQIWHDQAITTVDTTSTEYYKIGRDEKLIADVLIEGVDSGATMFITPLWEIPGGNRVGYPVMDLTTPQTFSWTEGVSPTAFLWEITPPKGVQKMYLKANTNDASGVTFNVSVNGHGN